MKGAIVSVLSTVDITEMKPIKVIWVMLNDIESAVVRQNAYTSYPTILKHFVCKGIDDKGNLMLEPYNDDVELKFVEVRNVNQSNN
tara:strand:+ start:755 stop:1012 length:258 start_codon:yes stop_codon:yes gene_type:complete